MSSEELNFNRFKPQFEERTLFGGGKKEAINRREIEIDAFNASWRRQDWRIKLRCNRSNCILDVLNIWVFFFALKALK